jgi:hypothetical protein
MIPRHAVSVLRRLVSAVMPSVAPVLLTALALLGLFAPDRALATPAYARRYDTNCATCHSPMPPRLNNVGMVFRRWGFRLPDSDDKGNLSAKMIPAHGIGDAIAIQTIFDAVGDPQSAPGENRGSLRLTEVGLVGGTSIDEHLSTSMIFLPRNDADESELEDVEMQGNWGKPDGQFSVRAGLAETFNWQKAGVGVLTYSSPIVLGEDPVGSIGGFSGFGLGVKQVEAELGYTHTSLKNGKMMSTMLSAAALNGVNEDGSAADRNPAGGMDFLFQATQLFGSRNTAGAFYYHGRTIIEPSGGNFEDKFKRYGVLGNYAPVDRVEVAASYVRGDDNSTEVGSTISMGGGYGELVGTLTDHWIGVYRYEQVDPDRSFDGDKITANVISTTYQALNNAFLTGEYREVKQGDAKIHNWVASLRFIY